MAPAGPPVVLELDGGAVGGAVHIHHHAVALQPHLLGRAGGAQAVQAQACKSEVMHCSTLV